MRGLVKKVMRYFGFEIRRVPTLTRILETKLADSQHDDYNWATYNQIHYAQQLKDIESIHTLKLRQDDYAFDNGSLKKNRDLLPLHPNHRLLYETISLLKPLTAAEFGCGGGDHLYNMNLLCPTIKIEGYDRSIEQIKFAETRSPSLKGKMHFFDITMPFSSRLSPVDIAFTQTVIMHIKTGNGHLVALSNMFKIATEQVVLMENWTQHPFFDDIKNLFEQGMLPWQEIHFYFRRSPELSNKPHIMVISSKKLPFEPLDSYAQLLENSTPYAT